MEKLLEGNVRSTDRALKGSLMVTCTGVSDEYLG
jgi:hypothetical protein